MKKTVLFAVGVLRILVGTDYVSRSYRREFVRFGRSLIKRPPLFR